MILINRKQIVIFNLNIKKKLSRGETAFGITFRCGF